jgi:hypothetical protein
VREGSQINTQRAGCFSIRAFAERRGFLKTLTEKTRLLQFWEAAADKQAACELGRSGRGLWWRRTSPYEKAKRHVAHSLYVARELRSALSRRTHSTSKTCFSIQIPCFETAFSPSSCSIFVLIHGGFSNALQKLKQLHTDAHHHFS